MLANYLNYSQDIAVNYKRKRVFDIHAVSSLYLVILNHDFIIDTKSDFGWV